MATNTKTKATSAPAAVTTLDFTDVSDREQSFNKKRVPAGDYLAKVTKVESRPTKETKEPQWLFTIVLVDKYTDRKFPYYCKLVPNQLWKVRNLLIACGFPVPQKRMKVDPNRVIGKTIAITLEDDEYDGKAQSSINAIFSASELEDNVDDEADEYDTEEEGEEEEEEDSEDEATDSDDEDDEEEEEEPEPVAAKKRTVPKARSGATKKSGRSDIDDVAEDELEELDLDGI